MKWLLVSLIFIGIAWSVPLNLKNDLDGNLMPVLAIKQGLIMLGDPINFFWHPLASLVLVLPVEISVRAIFAFCWGFTAIFSYFLFRKVGIKKELSGWLAVTFAGSGYFLARVMAGHLEKVLSYPLIPLFFLCLLRLWEKPNLKRASLMSMTLYLLVTSTDMYNLLYLSLGYICFGLYIVFAKRKLIFAYLFSLLLAVLLSAVRWFPMLTILGNLFKIPDPYSGSQNLVSLLLQIIWPKPSIFSPLVPPDFAWWEKTAFIGPLFAVILMLPWHWKKFKNNPAFVLALIFGLVCIAIAMPTSLLSPWHWLLAIFPPLTMFHVPSRVLAILSLCVMIIVGMIINQWPNWGVRLLKINLIFVAAYWLVMFNFKMFPQIDPRYAQLKNYPHLSSDTILYPAFDQPVLEREWQSEWQLFHTIHGTYIKGSPAADWTAHLLLGTPYTNVLPDYIVWPDDKNLPFAGIPVASSSGITLYKTKR